MLPAVAALPSELKRLRYMGQIVKELCSSGGGGGVESGTAVAGSHKGTVGSRAVNAARATYLQHLPVLALPQVRENPRVRVCVYSFCVSRQCCVCGLS